ncbi:MAG: YceI family protein [Methylophagaceae bacterium]
MNKSGHYITLIILSVFLLVSTNSFAIEWRLDPNNSQLNFISTKKTHISEIHQFKDIEGSYDSQGELILNVNLASVDTDNDIRDQRMKEFLFEVSDFKTARICATIDTETIDAIAEGASFRLTVDATLELHGDKKPLTMDIIITRLVGAKLSVVSATPTIINVADFSLVAGIEKLQELAKLPSISHNVPVSFYLVFKLKHS